MTISELQVINTSKQLPCSLAEIFVVRKVAVKVGKIIGWPIQRGGTESQQCVIV